MRISDWSSDVCSSDLPVLNCASCAWVSQCPRCTAYTVLHRAAGRRNYLQCHHCGHQARVPHACPDCGDQDLKPMGRRSEEHTSELQSLMRISYAVFCLKKKKKKRKYTSNSHNNTMPTRNI